MATWSTIPEESQGQPQASNAKSGGDTPKSAVLPVLRNWQVLDAETSAEFARDGAAIDGSATVVDSSAEEQPSAEQSGHDRPGIQSTVAEDAERAAAAKEAIATIPDQHDPAIVVTVDLRTQAVMPGDAVDYTLTVLNNGAQAATYRIQIEGWIVDTWVPRSPLQIALQPGEKRTVTLTIAPPRTPLSTAGDRALAFVVRNSDDPEHVTRLGALLTILPFTDLQLGPPQPATINLTWWQKRATVTVPLTNRSNYPVALRLYARQAEPFCTYSLRLSSDATAAAKGHRAVRKRAVAGEGGQEVAQLAPAATAYATVALQAREHPFVGLKQRTATIQLHATAVEQPALPFQPWTRSTVLSMTAAPCIGPWQLTSLVGLMAVTLTGIGLIGLIGIILFGLSMRQPPVTATERAIAPAPQPVIVAYIQAPVSQRRNGDSPTMVDESRPIASGAPIVVAPLPSQPVLQPSIAPLQAAPPAPANEAPPILSAEQVSSPAVQLIQSNAAVGLPVVSISAPATPAPMTYATMFHEIGARYDLSWRVLAAQAYVESSFDSLALGTQGDLGLMQVHPATWREWAPTLDVADPFDSYSNALVAAAYLDYLRSILQKRDHAELEWALVAYNWGIDKVLQHLDSGQGWQELSPNRQAYALEILRLAETIPDNR